MYREQLGKVLTQKQIYFHSSICRMKKQQFWDEKILHHRNAVQIL